MLNGWTFYVTWGISDWALPLRVQYYHANPRRGYVEVQFLCFIFVRWFAS
jgi:hypothetical protein